MRPKVRGLRERALSGALAAVPVLYLEGIRWLSGTAFAWNGLVRRAAFVAAVLLTARYTQPAVVSGRQARWPWAGVLVVALGIAAAAVCGLTGATWAATILAASLFLVLLGLETAFTVGRPILPRWTARAGLALLAGTVPVLVAQVETRFSEEEFFAAVQAMALGLFWATLALAQHAAGPGLRRGLDAAAWGVGPLLDRRWLAALLAPFLLVGAILVGRAYQHSFYPPTAPAYEGISAGSPFLCDTVPADAETYDGSEVFRRLLDRLAARGVREAPESAMLALGTGDPQWAAEFREKILVEAAEGRFAAPAGSVKWQQYEAALRAYYLPRVTASFPDLFSADESARLRAWFASINQRAWTVEPVDWLYALAFAKLPEGPYENQEIGAGLLALLESQGLATPSLSAANRAYLGRSLRGWNARFRNTDDAFLYQPEWINNAFFQSLYTPVASRENPARSFEWLLLQALPDGAPLSYNYPAWPSAAGVFYLGASLLGDPEYVWLADRALEYAEGHGISLSAQPGVEGAVPLEGASPTAGSCLLYGDSGLPDQAGPLAPDKIVFRDGWAPDDAYVLLNLRFSGWHRYKASNTIALVYQGGPLVADDLTGEPFGWLPVGRSLVRDKRIPRQNLSGLLVPRWGMDRVLFELTGIGGPWAQDPPFYAEVVSFETGSELDWSHTRLIGWHGWQHDRWVYFFQQGGPIIFIDEAIGPRQGRASLAWQVVRPSGQKQVAGEGTALPQRFRLREGGAAAEMLLVSLDGGAEVQAEEHDGRSRIVVQAAHTGRFRVASVLLLGPWLGAEAAYDADSGLLRIDKGNLHASVSVGSGDR